MKHYSLKPLHVALRPSRQLALLLGVAGTGACGLLATLPLPLWGKLVPGAVILLAAFYHIAGDALRSLPWSVAVLEVDAAGQLQAMRRDGRWFEAGVRGNSYVSAWLTVLNLRPAGRWLGVTVLLLPDALDAEVYRRLRVWLKWGQGPAA